MFHQFLAEGAGMASLQLDRNQAVPAVIRIGTGLARHPDMSGAGLAFMWVGSGLGLPSSGQDPGWVAVIRRSQAVPAVIRRSRDGQPSSGQVPGCASRHPEEPGWLAFIWIGAWLCQPSSGGAGMASLHLDRSLAVPAVIRKSRDGQPSSGQEPGCASRHPEEPGWASRHPTVRENIRKVINTSL